MHGIQFSQELEVYGFLDSLSLESPSGRLEKIASQ